MVEGRYGLDIILLDGTPLVVQPQHRTGAYHARECHHVRDQVRKLSFVEVPNRSPSSSGIAWKWAGKRMLRVPPLAERDRLLTNRRLKVGYQMLCPRAFWNRSRPEAELDFVEPRREILSMCMAAESLANYVAKLETAAIGRKVKTRATATSVSSHLGHCAAFPKQPPSVAGTEPASIYIIESNCGTRVMA